MYVGLLRPRPSFFRPRQLYLVPSDWLGVTHDMTSPTAKELCRGDLHWIRARLWASCTFPERSGIQLSGDVLSSVINHLITTLINVLKRAAVLLFLCRARFRESHNIIVP